MRVMAKAAPLPGQRGYKMKESEKLEEEAAAMEQRLGVLRQRMVDEKESWASEKYVRYRWCLKRGGRMMEVLLGAAGALADTGRARHTNMLTSPFAYPHRNHHPILSPSHTSCLAQNASRQRALAQCAVGPRLHPQLQQRRPHAQARRQQGFTPGIQDGGHVGRVGPQPRPRRGARGRSRRPKPSRPVGILCPTRETARRRRWWQWSHSQWRRWGARRRGR